MPRPRLLYALLLLLTSSLFAYADDFSKLPKCSTEKINSDDCAVYIDRKFPIIMPTFPMHPGKHIVVVLYDAFHFETVSLDPTTAQAFEGTDQGAGLVTAAVPNFKGFIGTTTTQGMVQALNHNWDYIVPKGLNAPTAAEQAAAQKVQADLDTLKGYLVADSTVATTKVQTQIDNVTVIYSQLKEVQNTVPRPVRAKDEEEKRGQGVPNWTPKPWPYPSPDPKVPNNQTLQYKQWRGLLLYELNGDDYDTDTLGDLPSPKPGELPTPVPVNAIGGISKLQLSLPVAPKDTSSAPVCGTKVCIFQTKNFDDLAKKVNPEINALTNDTDKTAFRAKLQKLLDQKASVSTALLADNISFGKVLTDLQSYYWNISEWTGDTAQTSIPLNANKISDEPMFLGRISDPTSKDKSLIQYVAPYKALGRQITYTVNVVNQVATSSASVATSTQKTAVVTITALYADPHFEVSSGAFFSSLANRSFANVTTVSISPNGTPTPVDIRIVKTTSHPEVLPYVAANYRLFRERAWPDQRRFASYATVAVALNPYNTLPEFAGGLSFSWRSIMISPLYHLGHSTHLTQGEAPGQIYCIYGAPAGNDPPACASSPPTPVTKTYWTNAIALGIGVRIPNLFSSTNH
jgi:hypothetical protein